MSAQDQARSRIAAAAGQLLELSHRIHAHPETAWAEHWAAGWTADALEGLGYAVTRGACQLPTAFTARIGTGDLHIGICAEYDALPATWASIRSPRSTTSPSSPRTVPGRRPGRPGRRRRPGGHRHRRRDPR